MLRLLLLQRLTATTDETPALVISLLCLYCLLCCKSSATRFHQIPDPVPASSARCHHRFAHLHIPAATPISIFPIPSETPHSTLFRDSNCRQSAATFRQGTSRSISYNRASRSPSDELVPVTAARHRASLEKWCSEPSSSSPCLSPQPCHHPWASLHLGNDVALIQLHLIARHIDSPAVIAPRALRDHAVWTRPGGASMTSEVHSKTQSLSLTDICADASSWATVLSGRHASSSAIPPTSSLRNMFLRSLIITPSPSCTCQPYSVLLGPPRLRPAKPCLTDNPKYIMGGGLLKLLSITGSGMSRILWDCLIPPDKKITTASDRSHTPRQMYSWFASASHHRHRSRTCGRNGFPKFTTTAPVSRALLSAPRSTCGMTLR